MPRRIALAPAVLALALAAGCASTSPHYGGTGELGYPGGSAALARWIRDSTSPGTLVVAHRGSGTSSRDENSVSAGLEVVTAGVPFMETDVRLSRDGEMFLMHDSTVDRRTTGEGRLADLDAAALAQLRLDNREPVPRLEDLYAVTRGRVVLVLDFKTEKAIAKAAEWVEREGSFDDFVFLVNRRAEMITAALLKRRYPAMMVMAAAYDESELQAVEELFGGALPELIDAQRPSAALVGRVHAAGARVLADLLGYERIPLYGSLLTRSLLNRGVDLLETDRPRHLWLYVRDRNGAGSPPRLSGTPAPTGAP